jgi:FG-GAP-like repeat
VFVGSKVVVLVAACSLLGACAASSNETASATDSSSSSADASTTGVGSTSQTGTATSSSPTGDETGAPVECSEGDGLCIAIDESTERCFCPQPIAAPFAGADVVHAADVDGDGFVDVIANERDSDEGPSTLWLWRGSADGLAAQVELGSVPGWTTALLTGDLDEDGVLDLVTGTLADPVVWTSGGAPLPTTLVTLEHPATMSPPALELGDFDGDAHLDLATLVRPELTTLQVAIWPGRGDGSFDTPVIAELGDGYVNSWFRLDAVDLDADAIDDVLALSDRWLRGIPAGAGELGPMTSVELSSPAEFADADGDGRVDALEFAYGGDYVPESVPVTVALGGGAGVFTDVVTWEFPGDEAIAGSWAQLDEDGALDVVLAAGPDDAQHLLLARGDGNGGFAATPVRSHGTLAPAAMVFAVQDLTADGRADVLVRSRPGVGEAELLLYVAQP